MADPATGRAVTPDTPFYSFSTGKTMTATVLHVLAQRGLLDYDTPIAELWPEFGAMGKQAATVRQLSTHTLGVRVDGRDPRQRQVERLGRPHACTRDCSVSSTASG